MTFPALYRLPLIAIALAALVIPGCREEVVPDEFVARVGERELLQSQVERALRSIPVPHDSIEARQQLVEQWVTNELMHQEALRRGLQEDEEVQRLIDESERAVLVNALLSRMYEENVIEPTAAEKQAYFESHREQLRLREGFARVRYLVAASRENAEAARELLQQAEPAERDSIWTIAIDQYASNETFSREISTNYFPESRIFLDQPGLRSAFSDLLGGEIPPVIESDSGFHVLQLVERVPSGTIPEAAWIDEELVRRLVMQGRKQLYARQVQRLRNEALAREDLEVR